MTNEELKQHFELEDKIFDKLCSENGNCNCCKFKYICESLSPKKGERNVKVQEQESRVQRYKIFKY